MGKPGNSQGLAPRWADNGTEFCGIPENSCRTYQNVSLYQISAHLPIIHGRLLCGD